MSPPPPVTNVVSSAVTPSVPPSRRPVVRVAPTGGLLDGLREMARYRDLLGALAARDLKLRYKQTILGAGWGVLQPLIYAAIFAFLFGRVGGFDSGGVPYLAFAFAGQVGWTLFGLNLDKIANSLVGNAPLVSKVYFPRLMLPLAPVACALFDALVALAVMAVLMLYYGIAPTWGVLLTPLWLGMLAVTSLGLGLLLASLAAHYRDVRYATPVLVQMLLFVSPVAYGAEAIASRLPPHWGFLYALNPLAAPLEGLRWSLLATPFPSPLYLLLSGGSSLVLLVGGVLLFSRLERRFADVI